MCVCPHTARNMCPHTAMHMQASSSRASSPETSAAYCYICVLILLYMCPHTPIYVSSYYYMCPHTTTHMQASSSRASSRKTTRTPCNRARLSREPSTDLSPPWYTLPTTSVSAYYYVCVRILLRMCPHTSMCRHTNRSGSSPLVYSTTSVSAYYYVCVRILVYVSSY